MRANRAIVSPRSNSRESARYWEVEEIVEVLIAKRGYHFAIDELLTTLHNLAEISLADPQNRVKEREFKMWARALETAIKRHSEESAFEQRVTDSDIFRARGMGIRLY